MPLYEVVLNQRYFNQLTVNRWNYMMTGTPAAVTGSFALLSSLGFLSNTTTLLVGSLGESLQNLQNAGVTFVSALARAVYIDDDFYDSPFVSNTVAEGETTASGQSPVDAFGFYSSRVKQSIGRGYKRFVGVSEGNVANGGSFVGGGLALMTTVAEKMSEVLTYTDEGNSLTFTPAIVQKEKYVVASSGKDAYRYYPSEVLQAPHVASGISWSPYDTSRSQVSRQYGRGQ